MASGIFFRSVPGQVQISHNFHLSELGYRSILKEADGVAGMSRVISLCSGSGGGAGKDAAPWFQTPDRGLPGGGFGRSGVASVGQVLKRDKVIVTAEAGSRSARQTHILRTQLHTRRFINGSRAASLSWTT